MDSGSANKITVVPKVPPLTAVRYAGSAPLVLVDGREVAVHAGDWLITRGKAVIDVVSATALAARYTIVAPGDLPLPAPICAQLETTLGIGSTRAPEILLAAVERLARLEIGGVVVDFTPGQWAEIKVRATKRGQTIAQAVTAVVDRIREDLFWRS